MHIIVLIVGKPSSKKVLPVWGLPSQIAIPVKHPEIVRVADRVHLLVLDAARSRIFSCYPRLALLSEFKVLVLDDSCKWHIGGGVIHLCYALEIWGGIEGRASQHGGGSAG